ncbi:MAG: cysteine--tRNA ligase, partial [Candidatus Omnitrophota bacterium]
AKKENTSLEEAFDKVRDYYIKSYYDDLSALGLPPADSEPKATDNILQMIKFIETLIAKGAAYEVDGSVYFSIRKFPDYGKLSGKKIDDLFSGVRIDRDFLKKDQLDFALWKKAKDDEPYWDSPWGRGRPGWHIECSVMSLEHLQSETIDIHGGGRDLVFPHHENEIAQSQSFTGKPFAAYWIHHGLLTIDGQKMSKSLGNYVTIKELLSKYPPDVVKFFFLQTHYSHPIDFSWDTMQEKKKALSKMVNFIQAVKEKEDNRRLSARDGLNKSFSGKELKGKIEQGRIDFEKAMDDDFNMPAAVAVLFDIITVCNKILHDTHINDEHLACLVCGRETIEEFCKRVFGLTLEDSGLDISQRYKEMVDRREEFRKKKMYKEADQIRRELQEEGIILEDTKGGVKWRKKL